MEQCPYLPLKDKDFMATCGGYCRVTFKLLSKAVRRSLIWLHSTWANNSFSEHIPNASARTTTSIFYMCSVHAQTPVSTCVVSMWHPLQITHLASALLASFTSFCLHLCLHHVWRAVPNPSAYTPVPQRFLSPPTLLKHVVCASGWGAHLLVLYVDTYSTRSCYIALYISTYII